MTSERKQYFTSLNPRNEDIVLISRRNEPNAIAMLRPEVFQRSFPQAIFDWCCIWHYYGDAIDRFLKTESNQDRWTSVNTDLENLQNLVNGKVI